MNPVQAWKIYRLVNQITELNKKGSPLMQYIPLIVTLLATLCSALAVPDFVAHHATLFAVLNAVAQILHSALPSTVVKSDNIKKGSTIAGMFFALIVGAMLCSTPVMAQDATATSAVTFSSSSEAVALHYNGEWSAGTHIVESLDVLDIDATHLYIEGHELIAPDEFSFYGAGVKVKPDLSKALAKTNLPSDSLAIYMSFAIGNTLMADGNSHIGMMAGGGVDYKLTSALTFNGVHANYLRIGSSNVAEMSTGLTYIFKK